MAERHNDLFREFDMSMVRKQNNSERGQKGGERERFEQRRAGIQLGLEIADVIEELNMLKLLFETQSEVLTQALGDVSKVVWLERLQVGFPRALDKVTKEYMPQVDRMMRDAQRVHKSLMGLLDLQQKEEEIQEAQNANRQALFSAKQALSAQDQADAIEAQSQILFIFTVVTIVFLPLSFFTSYFGMNIDDGKGGTTNYTRTNVNRVMGGASGPIIGLLLIGALVWYYVGKTLSARKRTRELIQLEDQDYLPDGLISETDPEYRRMADMRNKDRDQEGVHKRSIAKHSRRRAPYLSV